MRASLVNARAEATETPLKKKKKKKKKKGYHIVGKVLCLTWAITVVCVIGLLLLVPGRGAIVKR